MNKLIIPCILLLVFSACTNKEIQSPDVNRNFHLPFIVKPPIEHTIHLHSSNALKEEWFQFYGKYAFTDTLYIKNDATEDTMYLKDFINSYSHTKSDDTLNTDGFQLFVDYMTTFCKIENYYSWKDTQYFFPAFLVNETSQTKVFIGKDSYVFGIQEAEDTSDYNRWRPISSRGFDFCGNGYYGLKVHSGEFVLFLVPKYTGSEKGKMRIRLRNGEATYLSASFVGDFNKSQFDIKKDSYPYRNLKHNKGEAIQYLFYGASPKGYDNED